MLPPFAKTVVFFPKQISVLGLIIGVMAGNTVIVIDLLLMHSAEGEVPLVPTTVYVVVTDGDATGLNTLLLFKVFNPRRYCEYYI